MGDMRNNLRHLGMLATSQSWRRHWWPHGRQLPQASWSRRTAEARPEGNLLTAPLCCLAAWWQTMTLSVLAFWGLA